MADISSYTINPGNIDDSNNGNTGPTKDETFGMDDSNVSSNIKGAKFTPDSILNGTPVDNLEAKPLQYIKHSVGLFDRSEIDIFNKRYRFGLFMPYDALSTTREFLFFTKPDLNIICTVFNETDPNGETCTVNNLVNGLADNSFFEELMDKHKDVIEELEYSYTRTEGETKNPFNNLLANMCISNLSVPGLDAETIDTPTNAYGTGYSYRGSSEASNDNFDFSLEFRDTKYLPVYYFFRAYEEYETLKHHGVICPQRKYVEEKILHDQFSIYKFLVDEDMETIVYYAKFYGVYPKSLPRDVFSSSSFDSGLSYSIDFRAAFFDDMDPLILNDFNYLSQNIYSNTSLKRIDVYNDELARMDNRPATAAYVVPYTSELAPGGIIYKLKWRGSDTY